MVKTEVKKKVEFYLKCKVKVYFKEVHSVWINSHLWVFGVQFQFEFIAHYRRLNGK